MDIDVLELISEEAKNLERLADEMGIPSDIQSECLTAYFGIVLYKNMKTLSPTELEGAGISEAVIIEGATRSANGFKRLCNSVPNIPVEALEYLGMACGSFYGGFKHLFEVDSAEISHSEVSLLMEVAAMRGAALGSLGMMKVEMRELNKADLRKKQLSKFGAKGGAAKSQPFETLKRWALATAKSMHQDDMTISRLLSAQIPSHLGDISKNPQRVIYDALRANRIKG